MAYSEHLADRIRQRLKEQKAPFEEKKMMGGLCFMVDDKMCVGVVKDDLMARIGEELQLANMDRTGCRPMDFTGRPMKGYVFVSPEGVDHQDDLEHWVDLCLQFNPMAKSSKKKKK
ncbi:MAG: TfoX/Sxy family protein [Bacteroidia bacterium]|nr:TfoX/Sxy family protein [Bacteroidia bacterium]